MNFIIHNAIKIYLGILVLVILFHISILCKIVPYSITWGGRLQNDTEMYIFETISILVNVFLIWILLMKGGFVQYRFPDLAVDALLWIFVAIFTLNTIGNIFAKTIFEKQFSFLTGISALLLLSILTRRKTTIL